MASEINSGGSLEHRMKMIIATPTRPKKSRLLRACVLLGALTVLPFGLASARDYEAVQKRLQKSVEKGDLTQAEAKLMMEALKKSPEKDHQKKGSLSREEIGEHGKKIQAAVAAGKMTEEEGRKKMAALIEGYRAQGESGKPKKMDAEGFRRRLGAAVEAGKMTREEAAEKMTEFLGRGSNEQTGENPDWEGIKKRIEGAVEDGKISRQEADAKYREIKKRSSEVSRREEVDLEALDKRLRAMVEAGKLSKEDARAKLEALRKRAASKDAGETKEKK